MYKLHRTCRACNNTELLPVFELGSQPLSNDFRKLDEERAGFAPLSVLLCPNCNLAQLSVSVDPAVMYRKYSYVTSKSETMLNHFKALNAQIKALGGGGMVLEIGSNDGTLLAYLRQNGFETVIGIDPAENLAYRANNIGVPTLCDVFTRESAGKYLRTISPAGVVLARHVFCHIDDWHDFVRGLELVSDKNTLIGIEVPLCEKMLRGAEWDTIYHEHMSYFTLGSMAALLQGSPFHIHEISDYPIHGGSVVVWLRHNDSGIAPCAGVAERITGEKAGMKEWGEFRFKSNENLNTLRQIVSRLISDGKTVAGFGASAKATVCINACGWVKQDIAYVTDTTPEKIGAYMPGTDIPGTDIPIVSPDVLKTNPPDYLVLFAWNFRDEILRTNQEYINAGGKFISYVPTVEAIP